MLAAPSDQQACACRSTSECQVMEAVWRTGSPAMIMEHNRNATAAPTIDSTAKTRMPGMSMDGTSVTVPVRRHTREAESH